MSGLRERKKRKTLTAIHKAGMRLFAERGYAAVTVAEIAEAAEVSRATVFAYYPAKEDIVFGEARLARDALAEALAGAEDRAAVIGAVREWVRTLTGWVEPELMLQLRLAEEIPAVDAARSRTLREIEAVIAEALARVMGPDAALASRLVAGSLTSALSVAAEEGARRSLSESEVDALLDAAVEFVDGGLDRLT
jgi:AcrR family transcriptional regulator